MPNVGKRARFGRGWAIVAAPLLVLGVLGCGARAADAEGEEDDALEDEAAEAEPSESRGGSAAGVALEPLDTSTLPECESGFFFRSDAGRRCSFVFDNLCYETPRAACACACPRGGESRCIIGGFLSPDVPQRVTCFAL